MTSSTTQPRTALVTGAGEGLGREMALNLVARGYQVYGTALSPIEASEVSRASGGRAVLFECDVTDEAVVQRFTQNVSASLGEAGLDLLISNVGTLTPGPMETLTVDALRREFEIDVFGAVRVINAFLPWVRKARGRIMQISSWSAKLAVPFSGPSSACKAALEALADVYRTELRPFGVAFVVIQPGNMRTQAPAKSAAAIRRTRERLTAEQQALYGEGFASFEAAFNRLQDAGLSAEAAAALVIDVAEQQPAPSRAPIGEEAAHILELARTKSDSELDDLRRELLGLNSWIGGRAEAPSGA
jgi:NAD(P)-dependent dehydrogenase (short-subunit alcohol dehydrogenase family)